MKTISPITTCGLVELCRPPEDALFMFLLLLSLCKTPTDQRHFQFKPVSPRHCYLWMKAKKLRGFFFIQSSLHQPSAADHQGVQRSSQRDPSMLSEDQREFGLTLEESHVRKPRLCQSVLEQDTDTGAACKC